MKKKTKYIALVLLLLIVSNSVFTQTGVVHDPVLFQSFVGKKVEDKMHQVEVVGKWATMIQTTAETLKNIRAQVDSANSFYNDNIVPLRQDYNMVKRLHDNVALGDLWGVGEYMLGESLNPNDYLPIALKDPIISKQLDKTLGWSYQDLNQLERDMQYNDRSRYSAKVYQQLLPSKEDLDWRMDADNFVNNSNNNGMLEGTLLFFDKILLTNDTDSARLSNSLYELDELRVKAEKKRLAIEALQNEIEDRYKDKKLSYHSKTLMDNELVNAYNSLTDILDDIQNRTNYIMEIAQGNAQKVHRDMKEDIVAISLETLSVEMRDVNRSGNRKMADALFSEL